MQELLITRVTFDADLRAIHKIRARVRCKKGEGWLYVNAKESMARIVDHSTSVHSYWAPKGAKIDVALLTELVDSLQLTLRLGRTPQTQVNRKLKLAA